MGQPAPVGLGHLTMLDVAPPDLVSLAHESGFDAVGLRAAPGAPPEQPWPLMPGSPMLAETLRRMADTGIRVLDIELVRLHPDTVVGVHEQLLETGALLGARFLNVLVDDPDLHRARDKFAALVEVARPYGIRPAVEAIPYWRLKSLPDAVALVASSGGAVVVDALHLHRSGGTPADVAALAPGLLGYVQLCDAPRDLPSALPHRVRLPRGQSVDGIPARALEARAARLLPGGGDLPLTQLLAELPPDMPLSVEVPNIGLLQLLGPAGFARRARRSVERIQQLVIAQHATSPRQPSSC